MSKLTVTLLGTGTSQGIPVVACNCQVCQSCDQHDQRLRTSAMVQTPANTLVIDAGPDFRQQMLRQRVQTLDAIMITHNHKDHTGGLDDVRAFNWVLQKPVEVFARKSVLNALQNDYAYAFEEVKYPGVPQINLNEIDSQPFEFAKDTIIPIAALHGQMPVLGFRIGNFSYLTDANYISDEELLKMKGSKVIVINALRQKKHHSHFTLSEAIDILQTLKPDQGYITHISHQMGFHKEVSAKLPKGIFLGFDGLQFSV